MNKGKQSVICNFCEKEFFFEAINVKSITVDGDAGVVVKFFECPHCNKKYFCGVIDDEYSRMLAEYHARNAAVGKAAKKNATVAQLQALIKKAENYEKNVLSPYYAQLRAEWADYFERNNNAEQV